MGFDWEEILGKDGDELPDAYDDRLGDPDEYGYEHHVDPESNPADTTPVWDYEEDEESPDLG